MDFEGLLNVYNKRNIYRIAVFLGVIIFYFHTLESPTFLFGFLLIGNFSNNTFQKNSFKSNDIQSFRETINSQRKTQFIQKISIVFIKLISNITFIFSLKFYLNYDLYAYKCEVFKHLTCIALAPPHQHSPSVASPPRPRYRGLLSEGKEQLSSEDPVSTLLNVGEPLWGCRTHTFNEISLKYTAYFLKLISQKSTQ